MPASIAASMMRNASASSVTMPKFIVPSASLLTFRPDRPTCVYSKAFLRIAYEQNQCTEKGARCQASNSRRFLADPVAGSVAPYRRGPSQDGGRLGDDVDKVIDDVVHIELSKPRELAHPATDLVLEVRRTCALAGLQLPSRKTIGRRWAASSTRKDGERLLQHRTDSFQ